MRFGDFPWTFWWYWQPQRPDFHSDRQPQCSASLSIFIGTQLRIRNKRSNMARKIFPEFDFEKVVKSSSTDREKDLTKFAIKSDKSQVSISGTISWKFDIFWG